MVDVIGWSLFLFMVDVLGYFSWSWLFFHGCCSWLTFLVPVHGHGCNFMVVVIWCCWLRLQWLFSSVDFVVLFIAVNEILYLRIEI